MTQQEASEHYNIPVSILQEYKSWGLCDAVKKVMGVWQYDDEDLEWLSIILTLHDIGFTTEEAETYMRLLLEQPDSTNPYKKGDRVRFNGKVYESLIDNNVWSPSAYPAGWREVSA